MGVLTPGLVDAGALAPRSGPPGVQPPAPWAFAGLPGQTLPVTRFALERLDAGLGLRVQATASYGNLMHALKSLPAGTLFWRWRVDQALASADLRTREGDDVALEVCALFDMPRAAVPCMGRKLLRLADNRTDESLPNATLCCAWDPAWPEGSDVPNAYSARVRYITLGSALRTWQTVRHDLAADFVKAFGAETPRVPGLLAIAVGADADNTRGESLGYIAETHLEAGPGR